MTGGYKNPPAFDGIPRPARRADGGRFGHQQQVRWADCDAAQIAYTGYIPGFALNAIDAWWEAVIGGDFFQLNFDHGLGTPFVRLEMDLLKPITPRHKLDCDVRIARLGNSSIAFYVEGAQAGSICFAGKFVCVVVEAATFEKITIPDVIRDAAQRYMMPNGGS